MHKGYFFEGSSPMTLGREYTFVRCFLTNLSASGFVSIQLRKEVRQDG